MRRTLDRGVSFTVLARARTQADHHEDLGCSIQGPASQPVRRALEPLRRQLAAMPSAQGLEKAGEAISWLESTPAYAALCADGRRFGRRRLREAVLFPRLLPPRFLHLRVGNRGLDLPLTAKTWPAMADAVAALARGASPSELRSRAWAPLVQPLREARALVAMGEPLRPPAPGVLFVGHHTIAFSTSTTRVLVDPYFRPSQAIDLPGYQPVHARDLGRIDAVVITHSHGDHFHLGSLLTLPRDTPVFVPAVDRESLFSTDCAARLRQLGFTRVEALQWWQSRTVGDVTVSALPFYGEQPTDAPGPQAGLFNVGNTWLLRSARLSAAFFADAGDDFRGSMREVCRRVRRSGAVDLLFTGIRGFKLAPLHFVFSTLAPYLVNVPKRLLATPQQLMATADDALSWGELLGARHVVPCADGGAPWYWREGMGPRYPGFPGSPVEGASGLDENPDADPLPERLVEVWARRRTRARPLILRPGDAWAGARVRRAAPHAWPF
ncbi:MAG: MBL fold metallo-hydrolase [Archangiaceae bacterium]|nr:MBL fold metallo-hydrolase [Archangiaceae bacterium]